MPDTAERRGVAILLGAACGAVALAAAHVAVAWLPWLKRALAVVPATGTLVGQLAVAAGAWLGASLLVGRLPGLADMGLGRAARWYVWVTLGTVAFLYPAVRALLKP